MAELLQILVSGLAAGSIYALAAVGFTLLWQASQTINFAQGEFIMLPAFFVLIGMTVLGMPLWASVIFGLALSLLILGVAFKRLIVEPMLPHGTLPLVIATIALGLLMKESVKEFYGATAQPFPAIFPQTVYQVAGASVSVQDICNLAVSMLAIGGLQLFLGRTRTGRCMQASAQNPGVAEILGVNVKRMLVSVYTLSGLICALAGWALIGRIGSVSPTAGQFANIESITAVVIGGISLFGGRGSILGMLFGALIVGVFSLGLRLIGTDPQWTYLLIGVLIITAVAIDQWIRKVAG